MKGILQGARQAWREVEAAYWSVTGRTVDFAPQPLGANIDPTGLAGYFCDFRHKARTTTGGIPRDGHGEPDEWVIPVAQAALGFWELRTEGEAVEDEFLALAGWLMENRGDGCGGAVWRTGFAVPKYGLGPGWISAMAQGQAISVLLRAHRLTGRSSYAETAAEALRPLLTPVAEGGTQAEIDGLAVLEEYPSRTPSAVLNGWLFALFGAHELATSGGEEEARALFERSAAGLMQLLPRYDVGWWSLYSLQSHGGRPDLAKPFYQRLHPVLLEALHLLRPDPSLPAYARRWREQLTAWNVARASLDKVFFRVNRELRPHATR